MSTTTIKLYTLKDVAVNNYENGMPCWIIYRDSVYDCTDYLDDHPGGGELITEYAGKDSTKAFDDFGHSNDAKKLLKPLKIGELVEEDRQANRKKKVPVKSEKIIYNEKQEKKKKKAFSFIFC